MHLNQPAIRDINQTDGKAVDKIFIWNILSQNAAQELLHQEGEGTMMFREARIYVPIDTALHPMNWIFSSKAVRNSNQD